MRYILTAIPHTAKPEGYSRSTLAEIPMGEWGERDAALIILAVADY